MQEIGYFIYSGANLEEEPVYYCQVYAREDGMTEYNFRNKNSRGNNLFQIILPTNTSITCQYEYK